MATQVIEFTSPSGLTLTGKVFAAGLDTVLQSVSATERTNKKGFYTISFTDTLSGVHDLAIFSGSSLIGVDQVELTNTDATFQVNSLRAGQTAALATSIAAVETDTQDIQSRLPSALVSGRMDASVGAMAANTLTASALAADAVTEIAAAVTGVVVLPVAGSVVSSVSGTTITVYVGSETNVTISTDADLSAKTMRVSIETPDGTDVATIADGSITKTSSTVAFTIPTTATTLVRDLRWSLRDTTSQVVYLYGVLQVLYAAKAD